MKREDFRMEIERRISEARQSNKQFVDVLSRDVHIAVGGYPGNHRMPVCCEEMYKLMSQNDKIIKQPPKGKGASLLIRYFV